MEFWGAEVKVGEVVKVDNKDADVVIHLSQVALGESKKDKATEPVVVYLKVGEQKFVLGTLNKEKFPQIALDVVVEKEFELSHTSKNASVHFCGYKTYIADDTEEDDFSDDSSDEDIPLPVAQNGKTEVKVEEVKVSQSKKPDAQAGASKQVKVVEPKKAEDSDDESDEDDEIDSSDEEMEDGESDEEGESDEDDDEEDTPPKNKKVDQGKKRPNESATKTPISNKKAKNATPEKTDAKKGGHTATPHPAKKGGKTPNSDGKDTPKSGGQFLCKSCNKNFNSETGLQQHSKAKHGQ